MPRSRAGRLVYALLTAALLLVIGRNVYRRHLNSSLQMAISQHNPAAVRALLDRGVDANLRVVSQARPDFNQQALGWTLNLPDFPTPELEEIACLLIQRGARIRGRNESKDVAGNYLIIACQRGSTRVTRCLLEHGADPQPTGEYFNSPMESALAYAPVPQTGMTVGLVNTPSPKPGEAQRAKTEAESKRRRQVCLELTRLLRQYGASMSLGQRVRANDLEALRALLDTGTPPDTTELIPTPDLTTGRTIMRKGPTPLMEAATVGNIEAARLLLDRGANVSAARDDYPYTPLIGAIQGHYLEMVRLLLKRGAEVNLKQNPSVSVFTMPLTLACSVLPQIVPDLLARGADVRKTSGETLSEAIRSGHPELVPLLLKHGASVRGRAGYPVLAAAIQYQPQLVPGFLAQGADASERPGSGLSLVSTAVQYGRKDLIVPLLRAGAHINFHPLPAKDGSRHIPLPATYSVLLIDALPRGADMVDLLLKQGADPNMPSSQGATPLIMAVQTNNLEATRLLLAHGAMVNSKGKLQHTPLYYARRRKRPDMIALLQQAGGHEE